MSLKERWQMFTSAFSSAVRESNEDYDEYEEYDEYDEYDENADVYYDDGGEEDAVSEQRTIRTEKGNKIVSIHTTAQLNVVIYRPEEYDEVGTIANSLIEKNTVVLNLENTSKEISRRILDFLSGVAYAHKGKLKRIASKTYIITPYNVGLAGTDVIGELESNGVYF